MHENTKSAQALVAYSIIKIMVIALIAAYLSSLQSECLVLWNCSGTVFKTVIVLASISLLRRIKLPISSFV
jgi:hypothetical protein